MPDTLPSSAARTADALLRFAGGRTVLLRMPMPASPLASEQLGLATPGFQDIPLAPAAFRKARPQSATKVELLVSATIVELTVGTLTYDSAATLFAEALGIVIDDDVFTIDSATAEQAFGKPYLYRLTLRPPQSQLV